MRRSRLVAQLWCDCPRRFGAVRSEAVRQNFKARCTYVEATRICTGDFISSMEVRSEQSIWMQMCNQSLSRPSAQLQLEADCCGSAAVRTCQWVLLARPWHFVHGDGLYFQYSRCRQLDFSSTLSRAVWWCVALSLGEAQQMEAR